MIREVPPMGSHYFAFDGTALKPVQTVVRPERHFGPPAQAKAQ